LLTPNPEPRIVTGSPFVLFELLGAELDTLVITGVSYEAESGENAWAPSTKTVTRTGPIHAGVKNSISFDVSLAPVQKEIEHGSTLYQHHVLLATSKT
jgi:hypothetical protein